MRKNLLTTLMAALLIAGFSIKASDRDVRKTYRVLGTPAGEDTISEMLVRSSAEISVEKQQLIAWHFRNATRLADAFAKKEGIKIQRSALPARVELYRNPEDLSKATGLPQNERLGEVVARIDLRHGLVHLGRSTPEDLYVELGKWLYYESGYQWGQNGASDRQFLVLAEKFATFCLDKKNWTEAGGSKSAIR